MPAPVKPSERNAGKRWSTRDKRDLTDALSRGENIEEAASYLLRPVGEVARMAAELGSLTALPARYTIVLFKEGGEGAGVDMELAHENRLEVARTLYEIMCRQYPGRLVMLCHKAQVLRRSDRPD